MSPPKAGGPLKRSAAEVRIRVGRAFMPNSGSADGTFGKQEGAMEFRRQQNLLKTGALQDAIFNSANFSSIATDEKGVIQIFNVG
ncbi:MAG: hypothetical protein Q8Q74_16625, partial [Polaromonas sp.]|nr:hypothetical protein [Polaromonas sp.]